MKTWRYQWGQWHLIDDQRVIVAIVRKDRFGWRWERDGKHGYASTAQEAKDAMEAMK